MSTVVAVSRSCSQTLSVMWAGEAVKSLVIRNGVDIEVERRRLLRLRPLIERVLGDPDLSFHAIENAAAE